MLKTVYIILFSCICIAAAQNFILEWDIAVAIDTELEFLNTTGSVLGSLKRFSQLKALAFDDIRHQFVVSDMYKQNDSIYNVQLTKKANMVIPVIEDLPDDILGLAIDPITDTLYWSDLSNNTINYVSLKDHNSKSEVLIQLANTTLQGIALDVCRRYIYWTNCDISNPSIERATLNGDNREVLINDNLFMPFGITIDQATKRFFWAEKLEGIEYRISSANLNGLQRESLYEGYYQRPFGIAVDEESIYWTDLSSRAIWRMGKFSKESPEKLRVFDKSPMGLVTKHLSIMNISECMTYFNVFEIYNGSSTNEIALVSNKTESEIECLNGGEATLGRCKCRNGFSGQNCENYVCYNYCLTGNCSIKPNGYPQCKCPVGYIGNRCERNLCDGYCLNDGVCTTSNNGVKCQCKVGYSGQRCEENTNLDVICEIFCKNKMSDDVLIDQEYTFMCRCEQGKYQVLKKKEELESYQLLLRENEKQSGENGGFQDPTYVILSVCLLVMLILTILLSVLVCKLCRRPRIKKRIIVNKNITPLTYRPQPPSQQCEITIENCCNMNVCETPCFEPPQLRNFQASKKDEKKTLLSNMENAEDLY